MSKNNVITLNSNSHDVIREQVRAAVESGTVTYKAVSLEIGMSATALSQFMSGSYKGDNDSLVDSLAKWLEVRKAAAAMPAKPEFVHTQTAQSIWSTLQYAQLAKRIAVVYGNSGVGKSEALRAFSADNLNVWLVTVQPSTSSLLECLYEIAEAVGISDAPRRAGAIMRTIRRKLANTGGLLIIDEADHLDYSVLEELRLLQESLNIGLVLVGNHIIYARLSGGGTRRTDFARLFSRIAKRLEIKSIKTKDVDAIADAWNLGAAERKLAHSLAAKAGALRTLATTLDLAAILAQGEDVAMTEKHIRAAHKDLEGI